MSDTAKNALIWTIVIIAAALLIWGAFKLLSPGYIDKTAYIKRVPAFSDLYPRIGHYNIARGTGMSYSQSGQLYSPYAPGQNPVIKGGNERNVPDQINKEGDNTFFELFA